MLAIVSVLESLTYVTAVLIEFKERFFWLVKRLFYKDKVYL
jgi:uncharacterized membrane protein YdfJ with MMPL/SSD domain